MYSDRHKLWKKKKQKTKNKKKNKWELIFIMVHCGRCAHHTCTSFSASAVCFGNWIIDLPVMEFSTLYGNKRFTSIFTQAHQMNTVFPLTLCVFMIHFKLPFLCFESVKVIFLLTSSKVISLYISHPFHSCYLLCWTHGAWFGHSCRRVYIMILHIVHFSILQSLCPFYHAFTLASSSQTHSICVPSVKYETKFDANTK
jgi:hypothetical protein